MLNTIYGKSLYPLCILFRSFFDTFYNISRRILVNKTDVIANICLALNDDQKVRGVRRTENELGKPSPAFSRFAGTFQEFLDGLNTALLLFYDHLITVIIIAKAPQFVPDNVFG